MKDGKTGVYAVYYLYRSRYSFVADHWLKDGHHTVDLSKLEKALTFISERSARQFIADDLGGKETGPYFVTELTIAELLTCKPDVYDIRRASLNNSGAA